MTEAWRCSVNVVVMERFVTYIQSAVEYFVSTIAISYDKTRWDNLNKSTCTISVILSKYYVNETFIQWYVSMVICMFLPFHRTPLFGFPVMSYLMAQKRPNKRAHGTLW